MRAALLTLIALASAAAQVYSPSVLRKGDVDTRDLRSMAASIVERAGARTPRERAEAIWRFFLTDGRYVKPGFWYHIAGWSYEEPLGEVLDPMKQVHSYGFGLCYHIAPLLAAVYEAAGFEHARVWFLTGHTVAEVFYEGAYHLYDSDMLGYTVTGDGDFRKFPVASVRQLERDPGVILRKLLSPHAARPGMVDSPWYPADLREAAMQGYAETFSSAADNYLFAFRREPRGHTPDFVLRPGERMVLFSYPETPGLCYLPYAWDGRRWREFPREIAQYGIRTTDGPRSQKDARLWGTGRLESAPRLQFDPEGRSIFEVRSPYVIIDAAFTLQPALRGAEDRVVVETSTDGGRSWEPAGSIAGPRVGPWRTEPRVLAQSKHGRHTAVSGTYGYRVRVSVQGSAKAGSLEAVTRFQLNPRTLPQIGPGRNEMQYRPGPPFVREALPVVLSRAAGSGNTRWREERGQGFLVPEGAGPAELVFEVAAPSGAALTGIDAGGRFLDLRKGLAPDKLTAEVRKTAIRTPSGLPAATLEWSLTREGPYQPIWTYKPELHPRDGDAIKQVLRWPEVDERVARLPDETRKAYVRYRFAGLALDNVRLAALSPASWRGSALEVTHTWREGRQERRHLERILRPELSRTYFVEAGPDAGHHAVMYSCPR